MNILPKKRWHVRNKDNVARVRRDEAQAQAEEDERAARRALAEKEARTSLLRDKAQKKFVTGSESTSSSTEVVPAVDGKSKHINFFAELEAGLQHGSNKDYEAEKKAEKEKEEKRIGLLTYLGQSVTESSGPWYSKPSTADTEKDDKKSESSKNRLDPLNKVKEYLEIKKKHDKGHSKEKHRTEKHKKRKHNHEVKKKKKEKEKDKKAKLNALREERLKREQQERRREEGLLRVASGGVEDVVESRTQEQSRRYNSQYNPELARKPRDHRYHPY